LFSLARKGGYKSFIIRGELERGELDRPNLFLYETTIISCSITVHQKSSNEKPRWPVADGALFHSSGRRNGTIPSNHCSILLFLSSG
jgi:hypothetical protein